jgi:hypothetical protein
MKNDLFEDIKSDRSFTGNLGRILLFLVFLLVLDYTVSFFLEKGITRYYGLENDADIVLVGHSHLMLALDKETIERKLGVRVAKYTRPGVNVHDRYIMFQHYFSGHNKSPGIVVYSIDPWLFTSEGLSANSYKLFYPFMDNPWVDRYVHAEAKDLFDYFGHKFFRSSRFDVLLVNAAFRGYLGNWSNLKFGELDRAALKREIDSGEYRKITIEQENIRWFEKTLDFLVEKKVTVILLNTPIYHLLTDIQPEKYAAAMGAIRMTAARYPNVRIVDISQGLSSQPRYFFDAVHMNPEGQRTVTGIFARTLDSLVDHHQAD